MAQILPMGRKRGGRNDGVASADAVSHWFVREILPLEPILTSYLRRNWRNASDLNDLRQEVYVRTFNAARERVPDNAKRFLLMTARNLLIDRVRHDQVVPMDVVADVESFEVATDEAGPDRVAVARDEVRRLQAALGRLPAHVRQTVVLTYVEDLRAGEIAARLGVSRSTVSTYLAQGLKALMRMLLVEHPGDKA